MPLCGENDFSSQTPLYASMLSMHCKMDDLAESVQDGWVRHTAHAMRHADAVVMERGQDCWKGCQRGCQDFYFGHRLYVPRKDLRPDPESKDCHNHLHKSLPVDSM